MSIYKYLPRSFNYHNHFCQPHCLLNGSCTRWITYWPKYKNLLRPKMMKLEANLSTTMDKVIFLPKRLSNVYTLNTDLEILRKRISCNEASGDNISNIVPMGIVIPKNKDGQNMKIVIIPLDMQNLDKDALAKTLIALYELRTHAQEIDAFTNKMMEEYRKKSEIGEAWQQKKTASVNEECFLDSANMQEVNATYSQTDNEHEPALVDMDSLSQSSKTDLAQIVLSSRTATSLPNTPNTIPVYHSVPSPALQTQPQVLPIDVSQRTRTSAEDADDNLKADVFLDTDLFTIEVPSRINEHLNDLAISSMLLSFEMHMTDVRDGILYGEDVLKKTQQTLGEDDVASFRAVVERDPQSDSELTVPLQFNALINGAVRIDVNKLKIDHLIDDNLQSYQDSITSVAANIGGIALQNILGKLNNPPPAPDLENDATPCESNSMNKGRINLDLQNEAVRLDDPFNNGFTHSMKPTETTPENTVQITAMGKDSCGCGKKDHCGKKEDTCGKKKDTCGKKKDTCAKKEDPCAKKKDPCAKKKDPCAKKKDPCGKKKDPCGKKKDPCGKKKDPCGKKEDSCGKKKDSCGDGGGSKNMDPCAKFKKYSTHASPIAKYYRTNSFLYKPKRYLGTYMVCSSGKLLQMQMIVGGLKLKRYYAEDVKTKCNALRPKKRLRKDKKAPTGLRTYCFKGIPDKCVDPIYKVKCSVVKFPRKKCPKKRF